MPTYCLTCSNPKCFHAWDHVAPMSHDRAAVECPKCGTTNPDTDYQRQGAPKTGREWHGDEGLSWSHAFDPAGVGELQAECPSAEIDKTTGRMRFKSDSHQKRVYREMGAQLKRQREQAAEAKAKKRDEVKKRGIAPAAKKLQRKFGGPARAA